MATISSARRDAARIAAELAQLEQGVSAKRLELAAAQAAVTAEDASTALAPLPTDLVRQIFVLLPADARLRCREVCRGWCAFLSDASLWRVCDLSVRSGVVARRTPALLQAASAMAQGALEVLNVSSWRGLFDEEETYKYRGGDVVNTLRVLLPVLQANAGSLVELRAWDCFEPSKRWDFLSVVNIEALLAAAPLLRLLECDAGERGELPTTTLRLLEEQQFAPVRLQTLHLHPNYTPLDVPALAARLSSHPLLTRLHLWGVDLHTELALNALVDLAILQLQHLTMGCCWLSQASLPALTRMLGSGSLTELYIQNDNDPLLVGAAVPTFCAALRASRLVELTLEGVDLWGSLEDGLAVIAACTGHPTLRKLDFKNNSLRDAPGRAVIEAALDALAASKAGLCLIR